MHVLEFLVLFTPNARTDLLRKVIDAGVREIQDTLESTVRKVCIGHFIDVNDVICGKALWKQSHFMSYRIYITHF